jgi:hypothetical protein
MNSVIYSVTIPDLSPVTAGTFDLWATAESANITTYAPDLPGATGFDYPQDALLSAYNKAPVSVSDTAPIVNQKSIHVLSPNGGEIWTVNSTDNITWYTTGIIDNVKIEYSTTDSSTIWNEIIPSTPNDGVFEWNIPDTPTNSARVRVSDATDPLVNDISDTTFAIVQPDNYIYVDDSSTSPNETGTMQDPFKTITAAISVASPGKTILVDDSGDTYAESVILAEGVTIQSNNWDGSDGGPRAGIRTPDIPGACTIRGDGINNIRLQCTPRRELQFDFYGLYRFCISHQLQSRSHHQLLL